MFSCLYEDTAKPKVRENNECQCLLNVCIEILWPNLRSVGQHHVLKQPFHASMTTIAFKALKSYAYFVMYQRHILRKFLPGGSVLASKQPELVDVP